MPSPSKRYSQRNSPSRNRANSNNSDNEAEMNQRKTAPEILNNSGPSSRGVKFSADGSTTSRLPSSSSSTNNNNQGGEEKMDIGKRTGIQIPARGTSQSIPINNDGYEDLDKFFDVAGQSPAPPGLSSTNSNSAARGGAGGGSAARGGGNKKQSDKEQRNQEKHVRHEELLKEGSDNARQRPDLLNNEQVSKMLF